MSAVNVDAPGVIRIVAVRTTPVRGTGVLATIAFARNRGGDGVRSVRARLADLDGKPLEVRAGVRRAEPRGP